MHNKTPHHNSTRQSFTSRGKSTREHARKEVSAGGLVYKRTRRGLLVAMLKDSFGQWTFPKGHVRRYERLEEGAAREVREELGIEEMIYRCELGSIDIWFRDRYVHKGRLIHKFIHYYLFEAKPETRLRLPKSQKVGEKIHAVSWIPIEEVTARSNYKDMKPIIKKAFDYLKEQNKL